MKQSRKGSKRMVESDWVQVPNSPLLFHPATQNYFHTELQVYTDANGQPLVLGQRSERVTPRTPTSEGVGDVRGEPFAEDNHGGGDNYILSGSQAASGSRADAEVQGLATGVDELNIEGFGHGNVAHDPAELKSVAGSSSHIGSGEKKASERREEKVPAPADPRAEDVTEKRVKGKDTDKNTEKGKGKDTEKSKGKDTEKGKGKEREKGKGKGKETSHHGGQQMQTQLMSAQMGGAGVSPNAGFSSGFPVPEDENNDEDLQKALKASKQDTVSDPGGFGALPPGYQQGGPSYVQAETASHEPIDEDDDGYTTPTQTNPRPDLTHIQATPGDHEQIDHRYKVEPSSKFEPGQVFKVLWAEPQGGGPDKFPSTVDSHVYTERTKRTNQWGEKFYVGFRRFVVVGDDKGHCTCVPILTYLRQGCKKKGVKPSKHGIIHEYGTDARPLHREPKLGFNPVRMKISVNGEVLAPESRINYSKFVTVEHNVKVLFIGKIWWKDYNDIVLPAVESCWKAQTRRARRGPGEPH